MVNMSMLSFKFLSSLLVMSLNMSILHLCCRGFLSLHICVDVPLVPLIIPSSFHVHHQAKDAPASLPVYVMDPMGDVAFLEPTGNALPGPRGGHTVSGGRGLEWDLELGIR
jgi:hypothetical protein